MDVRDELLMLLTGETSRDGVCASGEGLPARREELSLDGVCASGEGVPTREEFSLDSVCTSGESLLPARGEEFSHGDGVSPVGDEGFFKGLLNGEVIFEGGSDGECSFKGVLDGEGASE